MAKEPRDEFEELLKLVREYKMSPEEKREQMISFVYGNCKLSNPHITREMVENAVDNLEKRGIINKG